MKDLSALFRMKVLVINLESRKDRLDLFQEHWNWIGPIERIDGIVSDIPHTGCGLAHCNAIRQGLEKSDWCLVLEDDARLNCSREEFLASISEALQGNWDAVILGPINDSTRSSMPDRISYVSENFIHCSSTNTLSSAVAVLWSRESLPIISEYEQLLKEGYIFPIDRMLLQFYWTATQTDGWHSPFCPLYEYVEITPTPIVWISRHCLVIQAPGLISDNTREASVDVVKQTEDFLKILCSTCSD